ncbi:hypothetical protein Tco_0472208 [Tanacetum coccineum]
MKCGVSVMSNGGKLATLMPARILSKSSSLSLKLLDLDKEMNNAGKDASKLKSCLKPYLIEDIDGKILGKDGNPLRMPIRNTRSITEKESSKRDKPVVSKQSHVDEGMPIDVENNDVGYAKNPKSDLEGINNGVTSGKKENGAEIPTFVDSQTLNEDGLGSQPNNGAMTNPNKVENSDFVLPIAAIQAVKHKFEIHCDDDRVFYFKFTFAKGLEQVLEQGPWLIRNILLILTKWTLNLSLSKDKVTKVPGRISFARALIEVSADKKLKQEVTMAIPKGEEESAGHTLVKIAIEYEWKPPICLDCHVFGHTNDQCPKRFNNNKNLRYQPVKPKVNEPKQKQPGKEDRGKGIETQNPFDQLADQDENVCGTRIGESSSNGTKLKNLFEKLNDITTIVDPNSDTRKEDFIKKSDALDDQCNDETDSDVEDIYVENRPHMNNTKGASTPSENSHVDLSELSKVCSKVFKYWDWTSNANLCTKGCRIILRWNIDVVNVVVLSQTSQAMHVKIMHKASNKIIYSGSSSLNSAMMEFKDYVADIEVMDINCSGLHFTWNQKPKGGGGILKKLDRIMGNVEFLDSFPGAHAFFQPYQNSDHSPANVDVSGQHMFQITAKLKALKKPLRKLVHDQGNLHDRVNKLRHELDEVQKALDLNPTDQQLCEEEAIYVQAFNEAKVDEEHFLKQKKKIEWLDVGDSNSTYFHKSLKSRNQRIRFEVILSADNIELTGPSVPDAFAKHYEMFLGTHMYCEDLNCDGLFNNVVSNQTCSNMVRNVTDVEIKAAMFSIGDDKAPGLDGYTSAFFKKGWNIVGQDVCKAVRDFFNNGQILKEINHTFIALIPKVSTPHRINDYRPISCCNVIYKCICKILTDRIIEGIKEVVSDNQSAFMLGRRISDNILITQELMHGYHRDKGPSRCAFKIDIQKAYDTVDWRFLGVILKRFGFHPLMTKWIMACVSSTSFSIGVNGDVHGFFKGKRGLRQGDPLSPYIFTLVMEILMLILKKHVRASESFRYHKHCEESQLINVFFTDDLFIFARGDVDSARVIMESIEEFKQASGLVPSLPKSTAYFCNVVNHVKIDILNIIPFSKGKLPVIYLGVPLISTRLFNRDCKFLVKKVKNIIGDWKNKSLSFAGRVQLCKSVISSMHVYWASVLMIPTGILLDIEQLIRGFPWCNGELKRGKAKVAWNDICLPKSEGGLGIRSLELFNIALMTTHSILWNQRPRINEPLGLETVVVFLLGLMYTQWWRNSNGVLSKFSVKAAWEEFRPRGNVVPWHCIVWFSHNIPCHAFHLWLTMRKSLKTQDKLKQWDVGSGIDLKVSKGLLTPQTNSPTSLYKRWFIKKTQEKHFELGKEVYDPWAFYLHAALLRQAFAHCRKFPIVASPRIDVVPPCLEDIVLFLQPISHLRTDVSIIRRLFLAASTYHIWIERNNRIFKQVKRSLNDIRDIIMVTVRLKLLTFRFKNKAKVNEMLASKRAKLNDENVSLNIQVESLLEKWENIKLEYQKLFDSIKTTHVQHQWEVDELIENANQKTYNYGDVRAKNQDLLMIIFELIDRIKTAEKGKNVNTKFDKSANSRKLLCVTPMNKNKDLKAKMVYKVEVKTDKSKSVTSCSTTKNEKGQKKNANVIARGMYRVIKTETQTLVAKSNMFSSNSTRDVKKSQSSVSLVSNKRDTLNSNVSESNANVLNAKTIIDVNDGSNLVCVLCGKDVFMISHDKCVARYALSVNYRVKRALFTSLVVAKSSQVGATPVVAKSRFSVATPEENLKVKSSSLAGFAPFPFKMMPYKEVITIIISSRVLTGSTTGSRSFGLICRLSLIILWSLKKKVLLNTKSKRTSKDVKKSQSSVSLVSNKRDTLNSNVSESNTNALNVKTIKDVNDGSNLVCVSCGKDVIMISHDKCVSRYALSVNYRVKRALFTSLIAAKSSQVGGYPFIVVIQLVLWIVDSGCSKHMTRNLKLLRNFVEKFIGTFHFGNDHFAAITGYGDYVQGNLTIYHVYYVEGLGHNLFSGEDLLTGSRDSNLYTISIFEMAASSLQNGVVERRNQTLVKAAGTMLIFSKSLEFVWAEAISTACFTQNLSLVHMRYNKTPYELIKGRNTNVQYFHVFGSLCYPINDHDNLGKMKPKADIEYSKTRTPEVSNNSAANTIKNEETPSSSSIIVEENEAPQLVSSSKKPIANEPTTLVSDNNVDEPVQEDVAELDENTFINPFCTRVLEEAESSSTYQDPSNMHEFYQKHHSTDI